MNLKEGQNSSNISESQYRSIIDFAPIGFYQTLRDGTIMLANNELASILGFDNYQELISKDILSFFYSLDEKEKAIKNYAKAAKSQVKNIEVKLRKKGGIPIWVLMTVRAIKDEHLITIGYDGFLIDITVRKKRESIQKLLLNLSKKSLLNIDLKDYLALMHAELRKIMVSDNFYITLYDKTTDRYTVPYGVEMFDDYNCNSSMDLHSTVTDLVRVRKQGMLVDGKRQKAIYKNNNLRKVGHAYKSWIGVPLIESSQGEAMGVLAIYDKNDAEAYSEDDLQTLELLASNAGIFIERIRDQEKLRLAKIIAQEGEARYRSLFYDNKSVMILVNPITGDIVDANKAACLFYGYSFGQITNLKISQINTLSNEELKVEMHKSLTAQKQHFNFKHRLSNGEIRDVEIYSGKVNFSGKDLLYSTVHDVTKRKLAEEKVHKLTASIEQSPLSVVITDLHGAIEYANPYFSKLTGYSNHELLGSNPNILNSGVQSKAFYKELWDTILAGNKWEGEICNKKKNGDLFWEFATISPLKNQNEEIINFVGIKEDISERKRMIEELIKAKDKAEESDRLKTAFLANMSHEIRTPMNGILGFTDLLLEPNLDNHKKDEFIQLIHQSGQRMLNTVNDLIEISKIEAGIERVNRSSINIYECINNLIGFFKRQAQKKGLDLVFDVDISLKTLVLFTDIGKLESILTNLIKNAVKFTVKGKIIVDYTVVDGFVEVSIRDTGIGISKHNLTIIFNRFQQVDSGGARAFEGSGLGLAITKSYVELLGGKIWMESVENQGSQFYFTIPLIS